jgi:hypothetical protein
MDHAILHGKPFGIPLIVNIWKIIKIACTSCRHITVSKIQHILLYKNPSVTKYVNSDFRILYHKWHMLQYWNTNAWHHDHLHLQGVFYKTQYIVGTYIAYKNQKFYGIFHQITTISNNIHCYFRGYFLLYAIPYTPHVQLELNILHIFSIVYHTPRQRPN